MASDRDPWSVLTEHQATSRGGSSTTVIASAGTSSSICRARTRTGFRRPTAISISSACTSRRPRELVGLAPSDDPPERRSNRRGVELDYGSNELGARAARCASRATATTSSASSASSRSAATPALLAEARAVVKPLLSRRVGRHYGGFATSQLRLFDEKPTAKRALYVLRTAATGRHATRARRDRHRRRAAAELHAGRDRRAARDQAARRAAAARRRAAARVARRLVAAIDAIDDAWPRRCCRPSHRPPRSPPSTPGCAMFAVQPGDRHRGAYLRISTRARPRRSPVACQLSACLR